MRCRLPASSPIIMHAQPKPLLISAPRADEINQPGVDLLVFSASGTSVHAPCHQVVSVVQPAALSLHVAGAQGAYLCGRVAQRTWCVCMQRLPPRLPLTRWLRKLLASCTNLPMALVLSQADTATAAADT